jgi:hypothetical protein
METKHYILITDDGGVTKTTQLSQEHHRLATKDKGLSVRSLIVIDVTDPANLKELTPNGSWRDVPDD